MLSIAIVDDEQTFRDTIHAFIDRYVKAHGLTCQVTCFSDGMDIADEYQAKWDIIFLDIRMNNMDGMAAAKRIRALDAQVVLIFITTLAQYAIAGYEVNALDFVLKPLKYPQFEMRMSKAVNAVQKLRQTKDIFLKKYNDWQRLTTDDILFVEVKGHSLQYVTRQDTFEKRGTIGDAEAELAGLQFARCNQSYLVNMKRIDKISGDAVFIGDYVLPISRNRKKDFFQQFSAYLEANY